MRGFVFLLPLFFVIFDRATKQLFRTSSVPVNTDLFFLPISNTSIAIGGAVFLVFLAWWMAATYMQKKSHYGEIFFFQLLLFVSISSNVYDRFQYGGVIDWIPLFVGYANLADVGICIAVIGLLIAIQRSRCSTTQ